MVALLLVLAAPHLAVAQDAPKDTADVKALSERVEMLEKTLLELKGQLAAIEAAKKEQKVGIVDASYARPDTKADNKADSRPVTYIESDRRSEYGQPAPARKPAAETAASRDDKGESSFSVYGFAMLDAGYQFKQNHPDWFDTVRPTKLPAFAGEFEPDGKTYWGVRQSRLGVKSSTPTKYGELKTIFEFELFGTGVDAGQTTFRLRHAYGELGKVGAGQYWTVFGDTDAFPNTFEYWGPNGLVWFRNVQLRFMPLKGKNSVTIALERPGASGDQGQYADRIELDGIRPKLAWPDLTGNVRFDRDWGHIQVSGLLGSIRWIDTDDSDPYDFGGSATRAGISVTSVLNFGDKTVGRFQGTYGQGIQNYMNDATVDVGARVNAPGSARPLDGVALGMFAMSAYVDHSWNKKWASAFGYSMLDMENSSGQTGDAYNRGHYGTGNLMWYPVDNVTIGGEFQWGRRENNFDGFKSDDYRIQFAFKYNFNRTLKL